MGKDKEHPHAFNDVAPGDSSPGEPGYDGEVTIGEEGGAPEKSAENPTP
jgi:hypothetical protein